MVIPSLSAITSGARIKATSRVRAIDRDMANLTVDDIENAEEITAVRRRARSPNPGKNAIMAAGSAASRSSAAVQDQLTRLKPGG